MKDKKLAIFSLEEIEKITTAHKEIIEALARNIPFSRKPKQEELNMLLMAFSLSLSAIMFTLEIERIDIILEDITRITKKLHERGAKDYSYMVFRDGVKVAESINAGDTKQ